MYSQAATYWPECSQRNIFKESVRTVSVRIEAENEYLSSYT